jgi:ABC-2 type transport system ATP-binding protein
MKTVDIQELKKQYSDFELQVSFSIEAGKTLSLVGPNGSGKTTLISSLLNIVRRDSGRVRLFELELDAHEVEIKRRIGVFFEEPRLFDELRVEDSLEFCAAFYPGWDWPYALKLLEDFGIEPKKKFKGLSKGMRAKAALVSAFAPKPSLLILDEPTSGLDPTMRRLFVEKVREAKALFSPTILLTSHILKDIEDLSDQIAFIQNGRILLLETSEALRRWVLIKGYCRDDLKIDAIGIRQKRSGDRIEFSLLTDQRGEELLEQLRRSGAEITAASSPDLEEIYNWIIKA